MKAKILKLLSHYLSETSVRIDEYLWREARQVAFKKRWGVRPDEL